MRVVLFLLATTLIRLDTAGLARSSDVVVRGRVTHVDSRWTGDHRRIITEVRIEVTEALKGAPASAVLVEQPGGVVGALGQRVEGVARFDVGEEVVVFLEKRPGDRFLVTGMAQGKFRVERSSDGKMAFAVPEDVSGAALVDPVTRRPVERGVGTLKLEDLKTQVQAVARETKPATP